ncbi:MAG: hypothetical protein ABF661_05345 [Oenococcus sp.]|uniref:hypothetical protein n=1 Tax=Oenococcus sp. TaxID=1979414 RepID=UPI0039EC1192
MIIVGIILVCIDLALGGYLVSQQQKLFIWDVEQFPQIKKITLHNGIPLLLLALVAIAGVLTNNRILLLLTAIASMIFAWVFLYQLNKLINTPK